MKRTFFITVFLVTSSFLTAQISNYTYDTRSDSSDYGYGQFIMEMPSGARLFKSHYVNAQDLLDKIKSQNKGKAIFIDFWATWCSPCLAAMPDNRILYIETQNLPVKFIYICTDYRTTMDDWITKISLLKQPGIHIFVEDEIVIKMWKILSVGGGFPSYIFIDKYGQFKPDAIPLNSGTTIDRLKGLIKK